MVIPPVWKCAFYRFILSFQATKPKRMKRLTLCSLFLFGLLFLSGAQTAQYAVVRQNGTTFICPSWDSAYAVALDGDYIYLPAVYLSGPITVDKRLFIYGAGFYPDSTSATGHSYVNSHIYVLGGASNGRLEGVRTGSQIYLGGANKLTNYTITNCHIGGTLVFSGDYVDTLPEFISVLQSIIGTHCTSELSAGAKNNYFAKNIFRNGLSNFDNCTFVNNLFLQNTLYLGCYINNSVFANNIFLHENPFYHTSCLNNCNNAFYNNLKYLTDVFIIYNCSNAAEEGNISVGNIDSIFVSYVAPYGYADDMHLKPTCSGNDAGTDGTDVGIYGTNNPTPEGWVPSNPHIYFKQIDGETGSDGTLHIRVGVRTEDD